MALPHEPTNQQLANELTKVSKRLLSIEEFVKEYRRVDRTQFVLKSDLKSHKEEEDGRFNELIDTIARNSAKLKTVLLPDETQAFMGAVELERLRAEFRKVMAATESLERLKQEVLSIINKFNLTSVTTF